MMLTLDCLEKLTEHHGDVTVMEDGDTPVTYTEMLIASKALAVALQAKDPTPGSRVGLCAQNSAEYIVSVLAILAAGKVLVPLNHRGTPEELFDILIATHPTTVIVDELGDEAVRCDDELKIRVSQFEGLVRTYRDKEPDRYDNPTRSEDVPEHHG